MWWDVTAKIWLQKTVLLALSCTLGWEPTAIMEAETEEGRQATVGGKRRPFIHQPARDWILPAATWVTLEQNLPPVGPRGANSWMLLIKVPQYLYKRGPREIPCPFHHVRTHSFTEVPLIYTTCTYSVYTIWWVGASAHRPRRRNQGDEHVHHFQSFLCIPLFCVLCVVFLFVLRGVGRTRSTLFFFFTFFFIDV